MSEIVLTTLNAKYFHSSFGLRYLYANLKSLQERAILLEFQKKQSLEDILKILLAQDPQIIGFGVYIWNAKESLEVVRSIRQRRPDIKIVLGGPEVSYESKTQEICDLADFVVKGEGDFAFRELCEQILKHVPPKEKFILPQAPPIEDIKLPYEFYNEEDIKHRLIYVEASRGCPFKCEFCLSSLDVAVRKFPIDGFLASMKKLHNRGVRHFKFVDRTFNLDLKTTERILTFFLKHMSSDLFLHFEVIPDRFPPGLLELLAQFPKGTLQLEVGIQTFNEEVAARIQRKQNFKKTRENLKLLREKTHAHIHADLIVGLPGEDLFSFSKGFDQLYSLNPHEIQVGILKRLKGTPIVQHTEAWKMNYDENPPFQLLQNGLIREEEMQRMNHFARFWEKVSNSGKFPHTAKLLLQTNESPFEAFQSFSDTLFRHFQRTHSIPLEELISAITNYLTNTTLFSEEDILLCAQKDEELRKKIRRQRKDATQHRSRQAFHQPL